VEVPVRGDSTSVRVLIRTWEIMPLIKHVPKHWLFQLSDRASSVAVGCATCQNEKGARPLSSRCAACLESVCD
jgi:hypothetical protein